MKNAIHGVAIALMALASSVPQAQTNPSQQSFVGTWVGTQSWAMETPPPGANQQQPVSIMIEIVDGKTADLGMLFRPAQVQLVEGLVR